PDPHLGVLLNDHVVSNKRGKLYVCKRRLRAAKQNGKPKRSEEKRCTSAETIHVNPLSNERCEYMIFGRALETCLESLRRARVTKAAGRSSELIDLCVALY